MNQKLSEAWVLITADKRKAAVLGILALVGMGLWVRAIVVSDPAPSNAQRTAGATRAQAIAAARLAARQDKDREPLRADVVQLPSIAPLMRDLFKPNDLYFPDPARLSGDEAGDPKSTPGSDDKSSVPDGQDEAALIRAVEQEASQLRLRSTMVGAVPIAVIEVRSGARTASKAVLRPGESIAGFTLLEVFSRSVMLEKHGVRVELTLPTP